MGRRTFGHLLGSALAAASFATLAPAARAMTWQAQSLGTANLRAISCPTSTACVAVGDGGAILSTGDGGASWVSQASPTSNQLLGISCPTATQCWAVGAMGTILHGLAGSWGGQGSWQSALSPMLATLSAVACRTTASCVAVGTNGTSSAAVRTTDGSTWTAGTPDPLTSALGGVSCPVTTVCGAVGTAGTLLITNDAGSSWSKAASIGTTENLDALACASGAVCAAGGEHGALAFVTGAHGWRSASSGMAGTLFAAACPTTTACWVAGAGGTIVAGAFAASGDTWTPETSGTAHAINGLSCLASGCWGVGDAGTLVVGSPSPPPPPPPPPPAPTLVSAPTVSGTPTEGERLVADPGSWTGAPDSYAYQWQACDAHGCTNLAGATGPQYFVGGRDVGATIDVVVTATNGGGATTATSAATAPVAADSAASGTSTSCDGSAWRNAAADPNSGWPAYTVDAALRIASNATSPPVQLGASLYLPAQSRSAAAPPYPVIMIANGGGHTRGDLIANGGDVSPIFAGLLTRGYAVLTWDERGYGDSTSKLFDGSTDWFGPVRYRGADPQLEVKDAQAIIDWLAACPLVAKDSSGEPMVGMTGASNGGLIQLALAAAGETRVKAITPFMSSADFNEDLFSNGVAKAWWQRLYTQVFGYGSWAFQGSWLTAPTDPRQVHAAVDDRFHTGNAAIGDPDNPANPGAAGSAGMGTGTDLMSLLQSEAPLPRADQIAIPTMIVQDPVDTGAPLQTAYTLYAALANRGGSAPPFKVLVPCMHVEGHVRWDPTPQDACIHCPPDKYSGCEGPSPAQDGGDTYWRTQILNWLDHYVKGLPVSTGPQFEWEDQNTVYHSATGDPVHPTWVTPPAAQVVDERPGTTLRWTGAQADADAALAVDSWRATAPATKALLYAGIAKRWDVFQQPQAGTSLSCLPLVGTPKLSIRGTVTIDSGSPEPFVYFKLLDVPSGYTGDPNPPTRNAPRVIGVNAMAVRLPTGSFDDTGTNALDLPATAWMLEPGHKLVVEATTESTFFGTPRQVGSSYHVTFDTVDVQLPTGKPVPAAQYAVGPAADDAFTDYSCAAAPVGTS